MSIEPLNRMLARAEEGIPVWGEWGDYSNPPWPNSAVGSIVSEDEIALVAKLVDLHSREKAIIPAAKLRQLNDILEAGTTPALTELGVRLLRSVEGAWASLTMDRLLGVTAVLGGLAVGPAWIVGQATLGAALAFYCAD